MHFENRSQFIQIILFNVLNYIFFTIMPIYNKEIFKIAPFPLFMTLLQMVLVIPFALFVAWATLKFPSTTDWVSPPKEAIFGTTFSSIFYGIMMASGNFGIFISGVDIATLFKSSGIIWQAFFAFLLLGEKMNCTTVISIILVLCGILSISLKFNSSLTQSISVMQCFIQMIATLFQSLSSIYLKKALNELKRCQREYPKMVVLSWRYSIACIPIFISSLFLEPGAWINFKNILSFKVFGYLSFGAIISQLLQLTNLWLSDNLSVISNIIISQFKTVPILVISHFMYKETKWTIRQIIGAILLTSGAALFSISNFYKKGVNDRNNLNMHINQPSEVLEIKDIQIEEEEGNSNNEYNKSHSKKENE